MYEKGSFRLDYRSRVFDLLGWIPHHFTNLLLLLYLAFEIYANLFRKKPYEINDCNFSSFHSAFRGDCSTETALAKVVNDISLSVAFTQIFFFTWSRCRTCTMDQNNQLDCIRMLVCRACPLLKSAWKNTSILLSWKNMEEVSVLNLSMFSLKLSSCLLMLVGNIFP